MESGTATQITDPQSDCVVSDQDHSAVSEEQQRNEQGGVCGGVNSGDENLQTNSVECVDSDPSHPVLSTADTAASHCSDLEITSKQQTSTVSCEAGSGCAPSAASSKTSCQAQESETEKSCSHSQLPLGEEGHEVDQDIYHGHTQSAYQDTPDQGEDVTTNGMVSEGKVSSQEFQGSEQQYEHQFPSDDYQCNQIELVKGSHTETGSSLMHKSSVNYKAQTQYSYSHSDERDVSSRQQLQDEAMHCQGERGTQSYYSGLEAQGGYNPSF